MSNRGYKKLSLGCLQLAHGKSGGDPQIYALPRTSCDLVYFRNVWTCEFTMFWGSLMLKVLVNASSILFVILEIQLQRRNMVGKQEHL